MKIHNALKMATVPLLPTVLVWLSILLTIMSRPGCRPQLDTENTLSDMVWHMFRDSFGDVNSFTEIVMDEAAS